MVVSVVDVIQARHADGIWPSAHRDGYKLALVIEGGGMRGVVSGGMVTALEQLGYSGVFDAAYGSSSGAMAAAYFLAGQAAFGTSIYYENINNRQFIDLRRMISPKPIMNTSFLLDRVCVHEKPLDVRALKANPASLNIVVSDVAARHSVVFRAAESPELVREYLRASINVPGVAGPSVAIGGRLYSDASVYQSIPFAAAVADGATHVLALLTRPQGRARIPTGILSRLLGHLTIRGVSSEFRQDYYESYAAYGEELAALRAAERPDAAVRAEVVRVGPDEPQVSQLETNANTLITGAKAGYRATMARFGMRAPHLAATLTTPGLVAEREVSGTEATTG